MIKKLSASHQEIKIEADAHFELKNWTLFLHLEKLEQKLLPEK